MAADLYAFGIFAQVHVGSRIYGVMFHFQRMASATHIAFGDDGSGSDTFDLGSSRSRVVHPMMCPVAFQDRMEAGVCETRSDAEEIQRSFQESLPKAVSFEVEIFGDAILGKRYGDKIFSLMCEDGSFDRGDIQSCRVVYVSDVIQYPERIPFLHVEEVDLPSIYIRNLDCQQRVRPACLDHVPKRRIDRTFRVMAFDDNGFVEFVCQERIACQVDDGIVDK